MISARYHLADDPTTKLRGRILEGLKRAAVHVWTEIQHTLNVPNTGQRQKRAGGGSRTVYPSPSKPGEPPRKRTGWLQKNIRYEIDEQNLAVRIGPSENARYGIYLETGTRTMAARPWLLVTAQRSAARVREIMSRAVTG